MPWPDGGWFFDRTGGYIGGPDVGLRGVNLWEWHERNRSSVYGGFGFLGVMIFFHGDFFPFFFWPFSPLFPPPSTSFWEQEFPPFLYFPPGLYGRFLEGPPEPVQRTSFLERRSSLTDGVCPAFFFFRGPPARRFFFSPVFPKQLVVFVPSPPLTFLY